MRLRPASEAEIEALATLMVGDAGQPTTVAGSRLFSLEQFDEMLEFNRVMIHSTGSWGSTVVAELDEEIVGMIQLGEAFLSMTPEIAEFAQRTYGEGFYDFLAPRLAAMNRVQVAYPPGCLRISEIHVDPASRGRGIGTMLLDYAVSRATDEGAECLALQTLTTNPARSAFEAWGFRVVETTNDEEFEAFTGASGYHLMVLRVHTRATKPS